MKKSINLTVYIFLVLTGAVGCTPQMQKSFDDFKLTDLIEVAIIKEALLANALVRNGSAESADSRIRDSMRNFSLNEENFAQKALSEHTEETRTEWENDLYGEMSFHPGRSFRHKGRKCREFKVVFLIRGGTFAVPQKEHGRGCLNPKTERWEWLEPL